MSDNTKVHGEPTEDMCCLVTMEDITKEDGNYGRSLIIIIIIIIIIACSLPVFCCTRRSL
jgi:hypothetical protein